MLWLPPWKVMRGDVSTYTFTLSCCWVLPLKVYPVFLSFFVSFFLSFLLSFFLSFFLYGATCQCSPWPHHFQDLHIVCRHLMALLGWQEDTNRKRVTNIGTPRRIQTHDPHVCMVEGSIYHRFCGHCGQLFEFWALVIISSFNYNFFLNTCSILLKCLLVPIKGEFAVLSKALLRNSLSVILNDDNTIFTALT